MRMFSRRTTVDGGEDGKWELRYSARTWSFADQKEADGKRATVTKRKTSDNLAP